MGLSQKQLLLAIPILSLLGGALVLAGNIFAPVITYHAGKDRDYELVMSQSVDASDFALSFFIYVCIYAIVLAPITPPIDTAYIFAPWLLFYLYVYLHAIYKAIFGKGIKYPLSLHIIRKYLGYK